MRRVVVVVVGGINEESDLTTTSYHAISDELFETGGRIEIQFLFFSLSLLVFHSEFWNEGSK